MNVRAAAGPEEIPGITRRHRPSDLYHERTNFQFIPRSYRWAILSAVLVVASVAGLAFRGLNLGIEFEGGTAWLVEVAEGRDARVPEVRDALAPLGFGDAQISTLSGQGAERVRVQAEVLDDPIQALQGTIADAAGVADPAVQFARDAQGGTIRVALGADADPATIQTRVQAALAESGFEAAEATVAQGAIVATLPALPPSPVQQVADALAEYAGVEASAVSISTVGPTWGERVTRRAVQAMLIFFVLLAVYLSFRFEWKMAAAAIAAVLHDVLVTVGFYAVFQFQVTPATVTAFLTILGFSLYDTVVVFDKVRENEQALIATGRATYPEMVNVSLNAVLMRSLSTSLVALLPVVSLLVVGSLIMGAGALEEFALALAVGLFIGSYSSLFIAAPLLSWWKAREPKHQVVADRRRATRPAVSVAAAAAVARAGGHADDRTDDRTDEPVGVPGPPAAPATVTPRPRQPRRRKRR